MKTPTDTSANHDPADEKKTRRHLLRYLSISLGGFFALVVILLISATLWLTPDRLSALVNREASEWLEADVRASGLRFTLWSSFPHFCLEADSLRVTSRTLRGLSPAQRDSLPADADELLSTGKIHGSVNLLRLLRGQIALRDLEVAFLDLNLVALNDTVANYSILPSDSSSSFKVPLFFTNSLRFPHMKPIRFFSALSSTRVEAPIDSARLTLTGHEKARYDYDLLFGGHVSMLTDSMSVLRDFPFLLAGKVSTGFHPFRVSLSDLDVSLARTQGKVTMDLDLGDAAAVDRFSASLRHINPLSLLEYLPGVQLPYLNRLKADMDLNLSARLIGPYRFSASILPSIEVDFGTSDASVEYDFGPRVLSLSDIRFNGAFLFNGSDPAASSMVLKEMRMQGEGMEVNMSGFLSDLLDNPEVSATLAVNADIAHLVKFFPELKSYGLKGLAEFSSSIGFRLISEGNSTISNPVMKGSLLLAAPKAGLQSESAAADSLRLNFTAAAATVSPTGITGLSFDSNLSASGVSLSEGYSACSAPSLRSSINLRLDTLSPSRTPIPHTKASISIPLLSVKGKSTDVRVQGINLEALSDPQAPHRRVSAHKLQIPADATALSRLPHTPEFLSFDVPARIRDLYARSGLRIRARVKSGLLHTPSFPADNTFSNLDISMAGDSITLARLSMRSRQSAGSISGRILGLRSMILSGLPLPLTVDLNVALDTVSINQLAATYAHGLVLTEGSADRLSAPRPTTLSSSDTTALLIPRNLILHVDASAKETRYTDLHLSDLHTVVDVTGGNARVNDLRISSDFGHAWLDLSYDSSDILNMGVKADLGLEDINVVKFFGRFHTLLLMMPQMRNLSGDISAEGNLAILLYPTMNANVPSLSAQIGVQGRNLKVHQDEFIRKITRMMLITTSDDLHIANMNVRASVHDNLLELYPFNFSFDRYRLSMQGVNNFNGRLYYHIGVLKSPLHLPFGINIEGMFSHPKLRFGGAGYKQEKGAEVTRDVMEENTFNLVKEMKYFLRQFVKKAAESDSTSPSR